MRIIVHRYYRVLALALCGLPCSLLCAQGRFHVDSGPAALQSPSARAAIVRASNGTLYAITVRPSGQLRLRRMKSDSTRFETVDVEIADGSSGVTSERPTNGAILAIDSRGILHVVWSRYHYPDFFEQYYRRLDPVTRAMSAIVKTSHLGRGNCNRSEAMSIAVGPDDTVYIAAPSTGFWQARLLKVQAGAISGVPAITDVGRFTENGSAQLPALAVDAEGRVHCAYFSNLGGKLDHVYWDPKGGGGWYPRTHGKREPLRIAGSATRTLFGPALASDSTGRVHTSFVTRASDSEVRLHYTFWSPESLRWQDAVDLGSSKCPEAHQPFLHHTLAVTANGQRVFVVDRAFVDPREERDHGLVVRELSKNAQRPESFLEHSSEDAARYRRIHARYALFPESMRMHGSLDLIYAIPRQEGAEGMRLWRQPIDS
ncbi:MAG: hypothetical protein KDC95_15310 [Planctomycetes bacterium]|nr:hypothetical protein [Planctomycetota bacterium]